MIVTPLSRTVPVPITASAETTHSAPTRTPGPRRAPAATTAVGCTIVSPVAGDGSAAGWLGSTVIGRTESEE